MKHQVLIIGGGPAGYTAAEAAGKAGLDVVLFEKQSLGGVCLNEGCIPTKTLLYSAKTYDNALHASKYAVNVPEASYDLPKIIARKSKVVRKLVLGVKAKLTSNHVTIVTGEAQIVDDHQVRCNDEVYEGEYIIICTGSDTFVPPIDGVKDVAYWTHKEALDNKEVPASLAIIGGGVIGMEFASFFNSLGVKVTIVEMLDEILGGMDKELSAMLRAEYTKRGIQFLLGTKVVGVNQNEEGIHVKWEKGEESGCVTAEKLLMSVGRRPVVKGYGLENLTLNKTERGSIIVNDEMETSIPNIYVCGDLTGFSMLAHTASREAEVAVHSILHKLGKADKADKMSYRAVPGVVYTNPEIAGVGQTEEALQKNGIHYEAIKVPMAFSGRFVAENEGVNGVCKLLLADDRTILGAHILGNPASEIITLAGMAIELKLPAEEWRKIIFPHPSVSEIFKEAL
jgi:dihydrolipoamide dehydrogenase